MIAIMKPEKVILDVDTATGIPCRDVDDGLAIALALASPEIELVGITTCAGNCRTYESTENSLRILQLAGREEIPVAEGRELPFLQDVTANFDFLDGWTRNYGFLWKDVPPLPSVNIQKSELPAHEFIIKTVREHPGEIVIVKEGSHTNLALALLVDPEIAPMIKEVIHMGGDTGEPWWASAATSEFDDPDIWQYVIKMNHTYDPEATVIVAQSEIPFTFVTSQTCLTSLLRMSHVDAMASVGTPYHDFLAATARPWVEWQLQYRGREGAVMWDPLTLALVFDPDLFNIVRMRFDTAQFLSGQYPYLYPSGDSPSVGVTMEANGDRFEKIMMDRLTKAL